MTPRVITSPTLLVSKLLPAEGTLPFPSTTPDPFVARKSKVHFRQLRMAGLHGEFVFEDRLHGVFGNRDRLVHVEITFEDV